MAGLPPDDLQHDVSRETLARLQRYHDLLLRWTRGINLIARSTREQAWTRHIADSLQLWAHAPPDARSWVDLGSGGGLPGVVIAIVALAERPALRVTLVESDRRKAAFLQHVVGELGLAAAVLPRRIEEARLPAADVISARALAPLSRLIALTEPFRHDHTLMLFPKGRAALSELTEAERTWHIRCEVVPSRVDEGGAILKIFGVEARR